MAKRRAEKTPRRWPLRPPETSEQQLGSPTQQVSHMSRQSNNVQKPRAQDANQEGPMRALDAGPEGGADVLNVE
jgi:hypothetical protein